MKNLLVIHETDLSDDDKIVIGVVSSVIEANKLIDEYYGDYREISFTDIRDSNLEFKKVIAVDDITQEGGTWEYSILTEWFELDCI